MNKKLAIVGAEKQTRANAPYDDDGYDIWIFNEWANQDWCKRASAVFQLHKPKIYKSPKNEKDPLHWVWLQQDHGYPIYMQKVDPDVPNSTPYPLDEINKEFLSYLTYDGIEVNNYRSTVSYATALAIYLGYEQIDYYGIEMVHSSEYHAQQPNFAFWVGVAVGRKVKVNLHCTQGLFDSPLYGYETEIDDTLRAYISGMTEQKAELQKQINMLDGALQVSGELLKG